jgi:PAS domain S-box-containing protein
MRTVKVLMPSKPTYEELARRVKSLQQQTLVLQEMEKAIGQSEHRLKAVFEANPDPMVVYNRQGHPQLLNPAFTKIFGWTMDDLRDRSIPFVPEDEKKITYNKIIELYDKGTPLAFETSRFTKSGELRRTLVSAALIKDARGQAVGMVANLRDITDQKKLEEQFQQTKKIEAIGQLAGGVAHDFNNMLSPIIGYAEILMMDLDPGQTAYRQVGEIKKAAERSRDLVQKLLAFSRKQTLNLKIVNLGQIIEGLWVLLERALREDIELVFKPGPDPCLIKADTGQLEQILMNLAVNARDAMAGGGRLVIETGVQSLEPEFCALQADLKPGRYVVLSVADTGSGMDAETRQHIFDPFFTTKGQSGTGLGLATVYGIVKQHEGAVTVKSQKGQGTVFNIFFPAADGQMDRPNPAAAARAGLVGFETILVVEDNHMVRDLACHILRRSGYTVIDAANGPAALELVARHGARPKLLLTDVIMPDMNGKQVYQELARICPGIKVLYMSGYADSIIANHGVLDENVNLIPKPFTMGDLAAAVRRVLDAQ